MNAIQVTGSSLGRMMSLAGVATPSASKPTDSFQSSGTAGRVTLGEAAMVGGAAALGALVSGVGGGAVSALGPAAGIATAVVGESVVGVVVGRVLTWGAHDGSAVGGLMMVGGAVGGIGGALGSIAGALTGALGGSPLLGGAIAGAVVAGGFATLLALGN